jgi:hypothetical protein
MLGLQKEDLLNESNVIQLGHEPNRIDLIMDLEGLDFETCFAHRQETEFEHLPIHFLSLDDLVKNKLSTGRLKDKVDAQTLVKKNRKKKK